MHVQTVEYPTRRGVGIADADRATQPAVLNRQQTLAEKALGADLGHKARAGAASSAAVTRTKAATDSGLDSRSAAAGALVALAVVLAGITMRRFVRRRGKSLSATTAPPPSVEGEHP